MKWWSAGSKTPYRCSRSWRASRILSTATTTSIGWSSISAINPRDGSPAGFSHACKLAGGRYIVPPVLRENDAPICALLCVWCLAVGGGANAISRGCGYRDCSACRLPSASAEPRRGRAGKPPSVSIGGAGCRFETGTAELRGPLERPERPCRSLHRGQRDEYSGRRLEAWAPSRSRLPEQTIPRGLPLRADRRG